MSEESFKSAYEMQQETADKLFEKCKPELDDDLAAEQGEEKAWKRVRSLCDKHAELLNDFRAVKEMNTVMAGRFDEVTDRFPLVAEIDCLLANLGDIYSAIEDKETYFLREKKIKSFRKIVAALEKHNENIRPKSYDESVETKEVE